MANQTNLSIKITASAADAIAKLKATQGQVVEAARGIEAAGQRVTLGEVAKGAKARQALLTTQREWEYKNGLASANQLKSVLNQEMAAYEQYSAKWIAVSKKIQRVDAEYRAGASPQQQDRRALVNKVGEGLLIGGAATLGGLAAATKVAADFDQALRNVDSIAHLSARGFDALRDSVLGLSRDPNIRQTPEDLARGLYDIYSSGFKGKQALDILKVSAMGASAGMTDTATASKVLMAVLNSGISGVTSAKQAMDVLFQEVNLGVNSFSELADSLGPVLPLAAKAGVSLQEVAAAMASMTLQGIKADEAATELKGLISHLIAPSASAAKEMDRLGIVHGLTAVKAEGLATAIQNVIDKTRHHQDSLHTIMPEIRSFTGLLALGKDGGAKYSEMLGDMSRASDGAGQAQEALTRQNKGASAQVEILKKDVQRLAIEVGTVLLPALHDVMDVMEGGVRSFDKLDKTTRDNIVRFTLFAASAAAVAGGLTKLAQAVKGGIELWGLLRGSVLGAKLAQSTFAAEGATLFLRGGAWAVGIAAAIALVYELKGAWDTVTGAKEKATRLQVLNMIAAGQNHPVPLDVDSQIQNNKREAARILKSDEYKQAVAGVGSAKQQIKDIRAGGVKAFTSHGENPQSAYNEYVFALKTAQQNLAEALQAKRKFESDSHNLMMDVKRLTVDSQTRGVGAQIAATALARQSSDAHAYVHKCQALARTTVEQVTHAFDGIWDRSPNATANSNLARFKAHGLAQPFTSTAPLMPGALLYSQTLGHGAGHVVTVGQGGHRYDQYGADKFPLSDFQYIVYPPTNASMAKLRAGGKAGKGSDAQAAPPPSAEEESAAKKRAEQIAAGKQIAAERTADAARHTYDALLDMYRDSGPTQGGEWRTKMLGHLKAQAASVRSLSGVSAEADYARDKNPETLERLKSAQAEAQRDYTDRLKAIGKAEKQVAEDAKKADDERAKKQRASERDRLESVKKEQEYNLRGLEIAARSAEGDQRKADLAEKIAAQQTAIALTEKHITQNSDSDGERAGAARDYAAALREINAELAQQRKELSDDQRQKLMDDLEAAASYAADLSAATALAGQATEEGQMARISGAGGTITVDKNGLLRLTPMDGPTQPLQSQFGSTALDAEAEGVRAPGPSDIEWDAYKRKMADALREAVNGAGLNLVEGLLGDSKQRKAAFQDFFAEMTSIGKKALAQMLYDRVIKKAFEGVLNGIANGIAGALASGGAGLLANVMQAATVMYGLFALSGAAGKKKQKHSLLGGIVGFVAGSLLPGVGNLEGAELGAALGGAFASGGRPPMGMPSIIGERGPELWVPDMGGTILPNSVLRSLVAPRAMTPPSLSGGMGGGLGAGMIINVNSSHFGDINSGEAADMHNSRLARTLANAVRTRN